MLLLTGECFLQLLPFTDKDDVMWVKASLGDGQLGCHKLILFQSINGNSETESGRISLSFLSRVT